MTPLERVRAALGKRFAQALGEVPERRAWERLPMDTLDGAFRDAQRHAGSGRAGRAFATVLIELLDARIGIGPEPDAPDAPVEGDAIDAFGRLHRADPGYADRERARRAREARAEEAYADAYDAAVSAGLEDTDAHDRATAARAAVLRGGSEAESA